MKVEISCGSCSGAADENDQSNSARRRAASAATAAYALAMGTLALLLIAGLALLAVSPALVTGRTAAPEDEAGKAAGAQRPLKGAGNQAWRGSGARPSDAPLPVPEAPGLLVMDVDAGADDAVALLLVLREEQLARKRGTPGPRLLAVTCTHGNTELHNVQRNVLKTLHLAGRLDIPVYSGASKSLITTPPGDSYFGSDGFGDFDYENAPDPAEYLKKEHAVNALIQLAREYPGQITLLVTGPLTNLGLAIRMDPEFLNNLKQLVIMGGSTDGAGNIKSATEFNFFLDPEANFIVFNSSTNESKPIYLVPWETVAIKDTISMDWRINVFGTVQSKYVDFLNKAERIAIEADLESGLYISADPVTAAILIRPDLILASEQHHVDAETSGQYSRGVIFVDYNDQTPPKNTVIIKSFNTTGFQNLLLENLS